MIYLQLCMITADRTQTSNNWRGNIDNIFTAEVNYKKKINMLVYMYICTLDSWVNENCTLSEPSISLNWVP